MLAIGLHVTGAARQPACGAEECPKRVTSGHSTPRQIESASSQHQTLVFRQRAADDVGFPEGGIRTTKSPMLLPHDRDPDLVNFGFIAKNPGAKAGALLRLASQQFQYALSGLGNARP